MFESLVHLGDLSNPVMPWHLSKEWSHRVIEEFHRQTKLERGQGLPVTMAMDNKDPKTVSKVQTGFIDYVARPLWRNMQSIFPEIQDRMDEMAKNHANWVKYAEQDSEQNETTEK